MRIAILGGSFDPPHVGHLLIAHQVQEKLSLDRVWLMPVPQHPFSKHLLPVKHRLAMARLLQTKSILASDFEIEHNQSGYTIDTLRKLTEQYPEDEFFWITGSDQLDSFHRYKDWQSLITNYNLIIFPRETVIARLEEKTKRSFNLTSLPRNITLLTDQDLILTNISSSMVRNRLAKKQSLDYIIPEAVARYIQKNKLYT